MKKVWHMFLLILSAVYLINPTAGVFELIPDNIPVIGNLDEVGAVVLLLSSLKYFGWDVLGRKGKDSTEPPVSKS